MQQYGERDSMMLAGGLGLGAALMFFFDPSEGRRRRAHTRQGITRIVGMAAGAATPAELQPADDVITARVRSVVERSVSYPRSVTVTVEQGRVILGGPVIAREVERLLSRVRKVRGVLSVRSQLDAHDWAADVPGLQGAATPPRRMGGREMLAHGWPTGLKLVGGAAIGALALRRARSLRQGPLRGLRR